MTTALASFSAQPPPPPPPGQRPAGKLEVHFNPASLKLSVNNTIQDDKPGTQGLQSVRKSATKLDLELLFDTTEAGKDVREDTGRLKQMGRPVGTKNPQLPMVTFEWGAFTFTGVIDSLQETIDFFSAEGLPLRSTIQLSMQSLDLDAMRTAPSPSTKPIVSRPPAAGQGATDTATQGGNPGAGRAVAAANGLDSMRFTGGAGLAVGGEVSLLGPVGFTAAAGAGFGLSAGAGISAAAGAGFGLSGGASAGFGLSGGASAGFGLSGGASAGFGLSGGASAGFGLSGGASTGFGFSADASASASFGVSSGGDFAMASASFGSSASAGVSASAGAFAGLGVSKSTSTTVSLDVERLRPLVPTFSVSAGADASFDATGRVTGSASAGLRADVGASARASFG